MRALFGAFGRKPLLQDSEVRWLLDVYRWLLTSSGGYAFFEQHTQLVLPTPRFFPVGGDPGPELATKLFDRVREYAGMGDWQCSLVAHEEPGAVSEIVSNMGSYPSSSAPAGSFSITEGSDEHPVVEISYSPSLLTDPMGFVATMAHELSHYLIATFAEPPPGGEDHHEFATDVCTAFIGFGVFSCNAAFRFEQFQDANSAGWSVRRQGYLSEEMLAFSLAVFLRLANEDDKPAMSHLSSNPRAYLKRALRDIDRNWAGEILSLQDLTVPAAHDDSIHLR